jgi:hypothetical protein
VAPDLAISYVYLPFNDASAVLTAKKLRARGRRFDLVSQDMSAVRRAEPETLAITEDLVGTWTQVPGAPTFGTGGGLWRFVRGGLRPIERRLRAHGLYEDMYSVAMWPGSHVLAALVKARHPGQAWSAEFSDPLLRDVEGATRLNPLADHRFIQEINAAIVRAGFTPVTSGLYFEWLENAVYALADRIYFTNERQREYMLGYLADPALRERARERSEVHPNPVLPADFYHRAPVDLALDPNKAHLAYFGAFYASRGVDDLVEPLRTLDPATRAALRYHVFTSDVAGSRRVIRSLGLDDVVEVSAYVSYFEFLALTTRFDVLVVADAHVTDAIGLNPYLPSKLSDYAGAGGRVWALTEPGSTMDGLDLPFKTRLGDVAAAQAVLRALARDKQPG